MMMPARVSSRKSESENPSTIESSWDVNNASRSAFRMLPVEIRRIREGRPRRNVRAYEIGVLSDYDATFCLRNSLDFTVWGLVAVWEIQCVDGVMPLRLKQPGQSARKLSVNKEVHALSDANRLTLLSSVAYASAARRSSRSRSS